MIKNSILKLKRFFSNNVLERRFYLVVFVLSMVFFVFLGIIPIVSNIPKKFAAVSKLKNINSGLEQRIIDLKNYESLLKEISPYMIYIREYIPEKFGIHEYLLDLVMECSKAGYVVQRFSPALYTNEGFIDVAINLKGNGNIDELVANIESMKRVTQINTVSIYYAEDDTVEMYITVYTIN